jgi:PAS domain S-box-containing protein
MTPAPKRADKRLQDLIEFIQFTEDLSVKIHGLLDKAEIFRTVAEEALHSDKYAINIVLLDDDGCHLRAMEAASSLAAQDLRARTRAAGVGPLTRFAVDVDRSTLWREVIREGRTVQHTEADAVRALFPPAAADVILQAPGHGAMSCVVAPLQRQGSVIGALSVTSTDSSGYLLPFVTNLAQHISHALEATEASASRGRAEAALRESEITLGAVLNTTSEAIFLVDAQYRIVAANQAFSARFDMTPDQIVGVNAFDILPPQLAAARREIAARELPAGRPFRFADRRGDRILETSVYPICDAQGKLDKIAVFSHDITELGRLSEALQESEARFRLMADVIPAMFWIKSPDEDRMLFVSAAAERILGYKPEDFYRQPTLWPDVVHPEDRDRVVAFCDEHEGEASEMEYRIVRRDGQVRWVRDVAAAVCSQAGEAVMLTGFVEDITERKSAEAQLRQAEKMASLGLLSGGIAHSLRNPLSVISACAQMQLQHPDDADLRIDCARRIDAATQRAARVIDNLLRLARPQDAPMVAVDVPALVNEVLVLLADHLAMHHVVLEQKLESGLPAIRGNPPLLQQVLVDLLLNACTAMTDGGTLTISAAQVEAGWVEIGVQDTGCGIPREMLSHVFEPFFTTRPSGVGLGLPVSWSIIRQHGGTIQVESEMGKGTTFTIRLPVAGGD